MTIKQALIWGTNKLAKSKSTSPALDAEVLLAHVLDKTKEYLMANPEMDLKPQPEKTFKIFLARRAKSWPVAYLTGRKEFFGLDFKVGKQVLIPRPETELLVELVLKKIKAGKFTVVDIGTGSGNIVAALCQHAPQNKYFASDISRAALAVAQSNAKRHQAKINFKSGHLLVPWLKIQPQVIVANLPYLAYESDRSTKFEPKIALIAKRNGLALFEELFKQITYDPRYIFLEIGYDQAPTLLRLVHKYLPGYDVQIHKDLSGKNRVLEITR